MALIKCNECGADISDKARKCPNCGCERSKKFCPECGKALSESANVCPECGYSFTNNNNVNPAAIYNGENYGLSIAGLVCSFLVPILGLIFGIIALSSNKGKQNSAKNFGLAATIISSVIMAISLIIILMAVIFAANTARYYPY